MRKVYTGIVRHRKLVLILFVIAAVLSAFAQQLVAVDYDMNDYLPPTSASTVALDVMESEFEGGIPNARVMIRDVSIPEALAYKEKLEAIDGVTEVAWLDDSVDLTIPLSMLDNEIIETYYKDGTALFTITMEEKQRLEVCDAIRTLIGNENAMTGSAVSTAVATTNTVSEILKVTVIAVLFVLLVLTVTMDSWLDPLVVLVGLGMALLINAGTNLIFGTISFVTNAAGNILQLAVSLDYSVFLIHRYEECREKNPDATEAMVDALCKSTTSILSSGLTTVIGFLALCLMQFQIGPDLGLALAKGVALSLITVFTFMPCLILTVLPLREKLRHRRFLPDFHRFGRAILKITFPMVCVFAFLIAPSYLASNANSYYFGAGHMFGPETQLGTDTAAIEEVFGKRDTYVLLVPNRSTATEKALSDELHTLPPVSDIISFVDSAGAEIPMAYLDDDTLSLLESEKYSRMVISVKADFEGEETFALVEQVRSLAETYYPGEWYLAGQGVSTYDLMDTVTSDMVKVNLVAILAVFLVMLLLQKDFALPVILVISIETAIWINVAIPYFMDNRVFYIAYLIISSIQLGATVDYAILMSDRYREFRQSYGKKDAVIETISSVTVSILTSGSVLVVVGFLLGAMSSNMLLSQLGNFVGAGGCCSLAVVLFVLPGLLYLLDGLFIRKKHKRRVKAQEVMVNE